MFNNSKNDRNEGGILGRRCLDSIFPKGSRRRAFLKTLFPKGSSQREFCKRIYYTFLKILIKNTIKNLANLVNNNIFYYTNERIELISKMFYKDLDVIIPTYNRAEYLQVALESICDSIATWRKTIIINNASTDNTLEVIENIKKNTLKE